MKDIVIIDMYANIITIAKANPKQIVDILDRLNYRIIFQGDDFSSNKYYIEVIKLNEEQIKSIEKANTCGTDTED